MTEVYTEMFKGRCAAWDDPGYFMNLPGAESDGSIIATSLDTCKKACAGVPTCTFINWSGYWCFVWTEPTCSDHGTRKYYTVYKREYKG